MTNRGDRADAGNCRTAPTVDQIRSNVAMKVGEYTPAGKRGLERMVSKRLTPIPPPIKGHEHVISLTVPPSRTSGLNRMTLKTL